jgi:hypothetical protein
MEADQAARSAFTLHFSSLSLSFTFHLGSLPSLYNTIVCDALALAVILPR